MSKTPIAATTLSHDALQSLISDAVVHAISNEGRVESASTKPTLARHSAPTRRTNTKEKNNRNPIAALHTEPTDEPHIRNIKPPPSRKKLNKRANNEHKNQRRNSYSSVSSSASSARELPRRAREQNKRPNLRRSSLKQRNFANKPAKVHPVNAHRNHISQDEYSYPPANKNHRKSIAKHPPDRITNPVAQNKGFPPRNEGFLSEVNSKNPLKRVKTVGKAIVPAARTILVPVAVSSLISLVALALSVTALVETSGHRSQNEEQFSKLADQLKVLDNLYDELGRSQNGTEHGTSGQHTHTLNDMIEPIPDNVTNTITKLERLEQSIQSQLEQIDQEINQLEEMKQSYRESRAELDVKIKQGINEHTGELNEILFRTRELLNIEPFAKLFRINGSSWDEVDDKSEKMRLKLGVFGNSLRSSSNQAEVKKMGRRLVGSTEELRGFESSVRRMFDAAERNRSLVLEEIQDLQHQLLNLSDETQKNRVVLDQLQLRQTNFTKELAAAQDFTESTREATNRTMNMMMKVCYQSMDDARERTERDILNLTQLLQHVNETFHVKCGALGEDLTENRKHYEVTLQRTVDHNGQKFEEIEDSIQRGRNNSIEMEANFKALLHDSVGKLNKSLIQNAEENWKADQDLNAKLESVDILVQQVEERSWENLTVLMDKVEDNAAKLDVEVHQLNRSISGVHDALATLRHSVVVNVNNLEETVVKLQELNITRLGDIEHFIDEMKIFNTTLINGQENQEKLNMTYQKMFSNLYGRVGELSDNDNELEVSIQAIDGKFEVSIETLNQSIKSLGRRVDYVAEDLALVGQELIHFNQSNEHSLYELEVKLEDNVDVCTQERRKIDMELIEIATNFNKTILRVDGDFASNCERLKIEIESLEERMNTALSNNSRQLRSEIDQVDQAGKVLQKIGLKHGRRIALITSKQAILNQDIYNITQKVEMYNTKNKNDTNLMEIRFKKQIELLNQSMLNVSDGLENNFRIAKKEITSVNESLHQSQVKVWERVKVLSDELPKAFDMIEMNGVSIQNNSMILDNLRYKVGQHKDVSLRNHSHVLSLLGALNKAERLGNKERQAIKSRLKKMNIALTHNREYMQSLNDSLMNTTNDFMKRLGRLVEQDATHNEKLNITQMELKALEWDLVKMKKVQLSTDSRLTEVHSDLVDLQSVTNATTNALNMDLEQTLNQVLDLRSNINTSQAALREAIDQVMDGISPLHQVDATLQSSISELDAELKQLVQVMEESLNDKFNESTFSHENQIAGLETMLMVHKDALQSQGREIETTGRKLFDLESVFEDSNKRFEDELETTSTNITLINRILNEFRIQLTKVETFKADINMIEKLQDKLAPMALNLTRNSKLLDGTVSRLNELDELKSKIDFVKSNQEQTAVEINHLSKEIIGLEEDIAQCEEKLSESLLDEKQRIMELLNEVTADVERLESMDLNQLAIKVGSNSLHLERLGKSDLPEMNNKITELTSEHGNLKLETRKQSDIIEDLKLKHNSTSSRLEDTTENLDLLKNMFGDNNIRMRDFDDELIEIKRDLEKSMNISQSHDGHVDELLEQLRFDFEVMVEELNSSATVEEMFRNVEEWRARFERDLDIATNDLRENGEQINLHKKEIENLNRTLLNTVSVFDDRVEPLNDLTKYLTQRVENLTLNITGIESKARVMAQDIQTVGDKVIKVKDYMRTNITGIHMCIDTLKHQFSGLNGSVEGFKLMVGGFERSRHKSEADLLEITSNFTELNESCSVCRRIVRRRVKVMENSTKKSQISADSKKNLLNSTLAKLQEKIMKLSRSFEVLKNDVNLKFEQMESYMVNETTSRADIFKRLTEVETDVIGLEAEHVQQENRTAAIQQHIDMVTTSVESMKGKLRRNNDTAESIISRTEALEGYLSMLVMELTEMKRSVNEVLSELTKLQRQQNIQGTLEALKSEMVDIRADMEEIRIAQTEMQMLEVRLSDFEDIVASQQQALRRMNQ